MLKITRRFGESLIIFPSKELAPETTIGDLFKDGCIEIYINKGTSRSNVSVGISAPTQIKVLRKELCDN